MTDTHDEPADLPESMLTGSATFDFEDDDESPKPADQLISYGKQHRAECATCGRLVWPGD